MAIILRGKKIVLSIALSLLTAICIGAFVFLNTPRNYMSIDINPSIEIQTNIFNKVVSVNAANEDAQNILSDMNLNGRSIEDVIRNIIEKFIENNYITKEADNEILLTVGNSSTSDELLSIVNKTITEILESKQLKAKLIDQRIEINNKVLDSAHQNNISAGKQSVIEKIMASNENVTIEELSSTKISDLLEYAKEKNIKLENIIEAYEDAIEEAMDNNDEDEDEDEDDDDKNSQATKTDMKTDSIKDSQKNQNVNSTEKKKDYDDDDEDDNDNNGQATKNDMKNDSIIDNQQNQNVNSTEKKKDQDSNAQDMDNNEDSEDEDDNE